MGGRRMWQGQRGRGMNMASSGRGREGGARMWQVVGGTCGRKKNVANSGREIGEGHVGGTTYQLS